MKTNLVKCGVFVVLKLGAVVCAVVQCGCMSNAGDQQVQQMLKEKGIVALSPSQGDVANKREWDRFGPGAIRTVKNRVSTGSTLMSSTAVTGDRSIIAKAMDPSEQTPLSFPHTLTVFTDSSGNFSAESLVSEAAKVAASASGQTITKVAMTFGRVTKSEPLTEFEMKAMLKARGIKSGWRQKVVLAPVFVDSIEYAFYTENSSGQSVKVEVPTAARAQAAANQLKVAGGQLETKKPTFIGFYPVK